MGAMNLWAHEAIDAVVGWDAPDHVRVAIHLQPDSNRFVVVLRPKGGGKKDRCVLWFYYHDSLSPEKIRAGLDRAAEALWQQIRR